MAAVDGGCLVHFKMGFPGGGGRKAQRLSVQGCEVYLLCSLRTFQFPLGSASVWLD